MEPTHAYLSSLVTYSKGVYEPSVLVKAHTWHAKKGWLDDRTIKVFNDPGMRGYDLRLLAIYRNLLREDSVTLTVNVPERSFFHFGVLSAFSCTLHGEHYATWVGDLHINPIKKKRGDSWTRRFVVCEAPGLDCGSWEGDQVPTWDL